MGKNPLPQRDVEYTPEHIYEVKVENYKSEIGNIYGEY